MWWWGRRTFAALGLAGALLCTSAGGASAAEPGLGGVVDGVVQSSDRAVQAAVGPVAESAGQAAAAAAEPLAQAAAPAAEQVQRAVEPVAQAAAPVTERVRRAVSPVTDAAAPVTEAVRRTVQPVTRTAATVTDAARRAVEPVVHAATPAVDVPRVAESPPVVASPLPDAVEHVQSAGAVAGASRQIERATPASVGGTLSDPPAAPSAGSATAAQPVLQVAPPVAPRGGPTPASSPALPVGDLRPPAERADDGLGPVVPSLGPARAHPAPAAAAPEHARTAPATGSKPRDKSPAVDGVLASAGAAPGAVALALLLVTLLLAAPGLTGPLIEAAAHVRPWPVRAPLERPG